MNKEKGPAKAPQNNNDSLAQKPNPVQPLALNFDFKGKTVRMINLNGSPWWVGRDVCGVLGYENPQRTMSLHCHGVPKRYPIQDRLGRPQEVRIIGEPDLFRLITHSKLPAAVEFEKLVFEEILPQIRQRGMYLPQSPPVDSKRFFKILEEQQDEEAYLIANKALRSWFRISKNNKLMSEDTCMRLMDLYRKDNLYKDIATLMGVSESTVTRWVKLLTDAGLLRRRKLKKAIIEKEAKHE